MPKTEHIQNVMNSNKVVVAESRIDAYLFSALLYQCELLKIDWMAAQKRLEISGLQSPISKNDAWIFQQGMTSNVSPTTRVIPKDRNIKVDYRSMSNWLHIKIN